MVTDIINAFTNRYGKDLELHVRQQILWRAFKCLPCLKLGKCKVCKCMTPMLFYAANKRDGYWPPYFYEKKEWESLQSSDDVIIFVMLLKQKGYDYAECNLRSGFILLNSISDAEIERVQADWRSAQESDRGEDEVEQQPEGSDRQLTDSV